MMKLAAEQVSLVDARDRSDKEQHLQPDVWLKDLDTELEKYETDTLEAEIAISVRRSA